MGAGVLVVGGGQAGSHLATTLRGRGYADPVTLVGEEQLEPYQRPPLSKEYLAGQVAVEGLVLRPTSHYKDQDIDLRTSEVVVAVDLAPTGGGVAHLSSGAEVAFEHLALTTGCRPRRLSVPGADLGGVLYLRDVDDAARLKEALPRATSVVVVGGGFIGLEAAAAARAAGKVTTVVEASSSLMGRVVAPLVSDYYVAAHTERGSRVLLDVGVAAIQGRRGHVVGVELADGTSLAADLVVVGIGADPRTDLARTIGLECDGGIVVDEHARTSAPGVVAAGDCTVSPNPVGPGRVRLESVQHAIDQAEVAASTIIGTPTPYRSLPWFWSNQGDLRLQVVGVPTGHDDFDVRGDVAEGSFSVLYYREDRLVSLTAVNNARDFVAGKRLISAGGVVDRALARHPSVTLKSLIASA